MLVVGVPAGEGRAVLGEVLHGPGHPRIVDLAGHLVVRADHVEVAGGGALQQEFHHLLRRPGARRLLGGAAAGHAGEGESGDQQVSAHLAAVDIAQRVLQALGEHFDAGLGDVVGGVAGWGGDALLGAGVDDHAGAAGVDHALRERLAAVDHAEEVGFQHAAPRVGPLDRAAAAANAGVVHQHGDVALGEGGVAQVCHGALGRRRPWTAAGRDADAGLGLRRHGRASKLLQQEVPIDLPVGDHDACRARRTSWPRPARCRSRRR